MTGKIQTRLALLAALAALVAVLVPSTLAFGSHTVEDPIVNGDPKIVYLTLGSQDRVTLQGSTVAELIRTRNNDCTFVDFVKPPDYLVVGTEGSGTLGQVKDGFGVQSAGDGSGEPCGRVEADDGEKISVALGGTLAGHLMTAIDVDLELKFNAAVDVFFYHDGNLIPDATVTNWTGMGGSDDGPDSKDGDNFRFNSVDEGVTGFYFDKVVFDPSQGAISLEGGADLNLQDGTGKLAPSTATATEKLSSQFQVVDTFDGQITCGTGNGVTISDTAFPVVGEVVMRSLETDGNWDSNCAELKNYDDLVSATSIAFVPQNDPRSARYTIEITINNEPIASDSSGQITTLLMEYSALGDFTDLRTLQACLRQPSLEEGTAAYATFWEAENLDDFFPLNSSGARDTACYYNVSSTPTGTDGAGNTVGREVWLIAFEDDPGFSFR